MQAPSVRNVAFKKRRRGVAPRQNQIFQLRNGRFLRKPSIFVSLRGAQRRGNLKVKGMASRVEAQEHEAKRNPYHKKHGIRCIVLLPRSLFQDSVSLRATIVRSGMANRSV